jgi:hypothetical protein
MTDLTTRDAIIDDLADRALARYVGRVPPETLAVMRLEIIDALETHPDAARLVDRLVPRAPALHSDELERGEDGVFRVPVARDDEKAGRGGR